MKQITLGSTGITVPQNGFGALPIQRVGKEEAVRLLRLAREGGMRFFDTARSYTDSEEKLGLAFGGSWDGLTLASKTQAKTPNDFRRDLETSLRLLKTDCIDIYQFHMVSQCYRPNDGTGMYECMLEAKAQGKIRHIGITTHKIDVAEEIVECGLYETLQYPFSYLSSTREQALVKNCAAHNMGFIAMKALAGGLIHHAAAAFAFIAQFENAVPIWGIQREKELNEWLAFFREPAELTEELRAFIEKERAELSGDFCRSCGYCMETCPSKILIRQCARMSLMLRRAPSAEYLTPQMQAEMEKIKTCVHCGVCKTKCPYELDIPTLLEKNYEDYKRVLAGTERVE